MRKFLSIRHTIALPIIGGVLFFFASCATNTMQRDVPPRSTQSAYGNYLAARFASGLNEVHAAAKYYAAALDKEPDNDLLRQQAFLSAMIAGNIPGSADFARSALGTDAEAHLMRLGIAAAELQKKRYASAQRTLSEGDYGPFNGEVRKLLQGWASYGAGDLDGALALINSAGEAPVFARIVQLNAALVLDLAGQNAKAETAYKIATDPTHLSDRAAFAYGSMLERSGRADEARTLYTKAKDTFNEAPMSVAALARMEQSPGDAPRRLVNSASQGAAEALYGTAQILAAQAHFDKALVYLEMARFINPGNGAAVHLLARLMEVENRPDDALQTFEGIARKSPYRLNADLNRARALFRMDQRDEAVLIFQTLAENHPNDQRLAEAYADALRSTRQYETALPIYENLIADQGDEVSWQVYFARGTVLERLGNLDGSIKDFRKALSINPDQPDILNYLGYTYINAGENLDEGFELIERALTLRPEAGYIVDSLGWAHYRLGHYDQAVRYLERAVELEPGEPTISDHLADAYWQEGRRLEARFQWSHTLSLKPDDDIDMNAVKDKLEHGLRDAPEIANAEP